MYGVIAVSLGLAAAAMFGGASVLEERSTKQVPERSALSPRLLVDLTVRPLWLALGCGADFGVNALLLKIVPSTLPAGFADPARQWPLFLMVIVTPVGFLLNQNAFQAGTLIAPVLAVITTADPLVSMAAGAAFLHEQIAVTPPALAAEGFALAVTIGGIIALAHRAPAGRRLAPRRMLAAQPGGLTAIVNKC